MTEFKLLDPKSVRGVAAVYALLALVVVCAIAGAVAFSQVQFVKHDVRSVKASLGSQDVAALATTYITAQAAAAGYGVQNVKVTSVVQKGDKAVVHATVKLTVAAVPGFHQTVKVVVTLTRGVWSPTGLAAA